MSCKPDYMKHKWGRSLQLTPEGMDEEVHFAIMTEPFVCSSVHLHCTKRNKIICNRGLVVIDTFPWDVSYEDVVNGKVEYSDFETVTLYPGEHVEIDSMMPHRIYSSAFGHSFITEIYTSVYSDLPPYSEDITRIIPGGQRL